MCLGSSHVLQKHGSGACGAECRDPEAQVVEKGLVGAPGPAPRAGRGARLTAMIPLWTVPRGCEHLHLTTSGHHPNLEIKKKDSKQKASVALDSVLCWCLSSPCAHAGRGWGISRGTETRPNLSGALTPRHPAQGTFIPRQNPLSFLQNRVLDE